MALPIELPRLSDYVFHYAADRPDAEAVVGGAQRWTWRELAQGVRKVGRALIASGVARGDTVAMSTPLRPEAIVVMLAAAALGAVFVGIDRPADRGDLRRRIAQARPRVILAWPSDADDLDDALAALPDDARSLLVAIEDSHPSAIRLAEFVARADSLDAPAFTEARTRVTGEDGAIAVLQPAAADGLAAAVLRHRSLIDGARRAARHWATRQPLRVLDDLPVDHLAGIALLPALALVSGGTLVCRGAADEPSALTDIASEHITLWLTTVPRLAAAAADPAFSTAALDGLKHVVAFGGPFPQGLLESFVRRPLPAQIGVAFGTAELAGIASVTDPGADEDALAGSIGRPDPGLELRLADAEGRPPEPGAPGEIQSQASAAMRGRLGDALDASLTADGWHRSGQLAVLRPDGSWSWAGRSADAFVSDGLVIRPIEIERAIEAHPKVAAAVVLGVPDPIYQRVGNALVEPASGRSLTVDELFVWCREHLPAHLVPKRFGIVPGLPRTSAGEVDRRALARQLAERASSDW